MAATPPIRFTDTGGDFPIRFLDAHNDQIAQAPQLGLLTWHEMDYWLEILIEQDPDSSISYSPFRCSEEGDPTDPLRLHGERIVMRDNASIIDPGYYVILSPEGDAIQINVSQERPDPRAPSHSVNTTDSGIKSFRTRIRERDGRCLFTGARPINGDFTGLESCHIMGLASIDQKWIREVCSRLITDDHEGIGESGMNSIQNGILLSTGIHLFFDKYLIGVNPQNGYKIYCFWPNGSDIERADGNIMFQDPTVPEKHRPFRDLLQNHFRMCVLKNMKGGAGIPEWDEDMPPGCDHLAEVSNSDQGQLRPETILATRLNHLIV